MSPIRATKSQNYSKGLDSALKSLRKQREEVKSNTYHKERKKGEIDYNTQQNYYNRKMNNASVSKFDIASVDKLDMPARLGYGKTASDIEYDTK